MANLTYSQQLKHPNWQRRRLEMLNGANFECQNCGDKNKMLHVHHKQYFKNRMPWEYSDTELIVLCEDCHKEEHKSTDGIKKLLSEIGTNEAYPLVAGFNFWNDGCNGTKREDAKEANATAYAAGFVAWLVYHLDIGEMDKVAAFATSLMNDMAEPGLVYRHNTAKMFGREESNG